MTARLAFFGSPEFAVPSLRALAGAGFEVAVVVTQPDRPVGRGGRMAPPPVKRAALELGLRVEQPESVRGAAFRDLLRKLELDAGVVAAYGKILPQGVLDAPRRGMVNVHASLLPRWRGASPVTAAILAGDTITGVSIMELVLQMDAGPVVSRVEEPIRPDDTTGSLEARLAELGAAELVRVLPDWLEGRLRAVPQDDAAATYCGLIRKQDGHLRASMTAAEAERAMRAYDPWPGAYVLYRGDALRCWRGRPVEGPAAPAGTMALIGGEPAVRFADGWVALTEVQRPGGRRMPGRAFVAGERGQLAPQVGLA
ncbi:MAG: methionyl-tRNA formyltransferase [Tepidiforma sp.]|nr:MAG: methionyl-tRNA formyltransferase [Tepidiforma sp.]